jgi:hypothetical protein
MPRNTGSSDNTVKAKNLSEEQLAQASSVSERQQKTVEVTYGNGDVTFTPDGGFSGSWSNQQQATKASSNRTN